MGSDLLADRAWQAERAGRLDGLKIERIGPACNRSRPLHAAGALNWRTHSQEPNFRDDWFGSAALVLGSWYLCVFSLSERQSKSDLTYTLLRLLEIPRKP
jgi:hypothetical protein